MAERLLPVEEGLQPCNVAAFAVLFEGLREAYVGRVPRSLIYGGDLYMQRRSAPLGVRATKIPKEYGKSITIRRGKDPQGSRIENEIHTCRGTNGAAAIHGIYAESSGGLPHTERVIVGPEHMSAILLRFTVIATSMQRMQRYSHIGLRLKQLAAELRQWNPAAVEPADPLILSLPGARSV